MTKPVNDINRRDFLKVASGVGVASLLGAASVSGAEPNSPKKEENAKPAEKLPDMPTRKLGKTGVKVTILNHGLMFDVVPNQIVLQKAIEWGVTMWDTAAGYGGGKSEEGIGMYFEKNPDVRKKIFLVTKTSGANGPDDMTAKLTTSLERMKTDHVDLIFMHGINGGDALTPEVKVWAESMKKSGKIKFFGFSTHSNMNACMTAAAEKGWIDAIMPTVNFRTLQEDATKKALDACMKAEVGVVAMKAMGMSRRRRGEQQAPVEADPAEKVLEHFSQKGFSVEQAKLKYVWQQEAIASICVSLLGTNFAAAVDRADLKLADIAVLDQYAKATCDGYCQACLQCENGQFANSIPDVMRCLMYHNSYRDPQMAQDYFAQIPASFRSRLATGDFSAAEARCPQGLPITSMMREASQKLV
jgi:predicted aldo/keto reductase-like oxidoreductase